MVEIDHALKYYIIVFLEIVFPTLIFGKTSITITY